jgi:hypothetical protein
MFAGAALRPGSVWEALYDLVDCPAFSNNLPLLRFLIEHTRATRLWQPAPVPTALLKDSHYWRVIERISPPGTSMSHNIVLDDLTRIINACEISADIFKWNHSTWNDPVREIDITDQNNTAKKRKTMPSTVDSHTVGSSLYGEQSGFASTSFARSFTLYTS